MQLTCYHNGSHYVKRDESFDFLLTLITNGIHNGETPEMVEIVADKRADYANAIARIGELARYMHFELFAAIKILLTEEYGNFESGYCESLEITEKELPEE